MDDGTKVEWKGEEKTPEHQGAAEKKEMHVRT
jgi:hypothetical protein